jgi:hypothetical protein
MLKRDLSRDDLKSSSQVFITEALRFLMSLSWIAVGETLERTLIKCNVIYIIY